MAYSPLVNFLLKATRKSARLLLRDFFELENLQNSKRPTTDFVARSKAKLEESLREELERYPSSIIAYDTSKPDPTKGIHFIITPIDGEMNFGRAIPFFASIVVACEYKNGELLPFVSVINFPALGEVIYVEHGRGVFMERSVDNASQHSLRLRVSAHEAMDNALIISDFGSFRNHRMIGSDMYSSYLIASGKADIFLSNSMNEGVKLATGLIVHEAGGRTYADKEVEGCTAKFISCNGQFKFS